MLDLISTEHGNLFGSRGRPNGTILGTKRQEVAEWKFEILDTDRDGDLSRSEVRGWWREAVRRVVRPRKCGRDWMRYCDQDGDSRVTSKEWSSCLGASENSESSVELASKHDAFFLILVSFSLFSSLISEEDTERRERERRRKEKLEGRGGGDTQGDQARLDSVGCEQARIEAGREVMRRGPGGQAAGLFVPECDLSGQYEPVQCYR